MKEIRIALDDISSGDGVPCFHCLIGALIGSFARQFPEARAEDMLNMTCLALVEAVDFVAKTEEDKANNFQALLNNITKAHQMLLEEGNNSGCTH
jgi:hypothetical protein